MIHLQDAISGDARLPLTALLLLALCIGQCGGKSSHLIREELEALLKEDLAHILGEIPGEETLSSPRFEIVEYERFPKDVNFSYKAVVDFYYFKSIRMKQVRKYRYRVLQQQWDRYHKELKHLPE